jgi:hypothetical protein
MPPNDAGHGYLEDAVTGHVIAGVGTSGLPTTACLASWTIP